MANLKTAAQASLHTLGTLKTKKLSASGRIGTYAAMAALFVQTKAGEPMRDFYETALHAKPGFGRTEPVL